MLLPKAIARDVEEMGRYLLEQKYSTPQYLSIHIYDTLACPLPHENIRFRKKRHFFKEIFIFIAYLTKTLNIDDLVC